jgi:hypothetical protein
LLLAIGATLAAASPLATLVPDAARRAELLAGEDLRSSATGKASYELALAPRHPLAAAQALAIRSEAGDVAVEALFFLPRPSGSPRDEASELAAAYHILRSVSTLEGIEYWSASRERMRLFYEESWRISGPSDPSRLPDAPPFPAPAFDRIWAWQRDLSFSGNIYEIDYSVSADPAAGGAIVMRSTNVTGMSYGILPVVGPRRLVVRVLVIPVDEGYLFWAVSSAKAAAIPGMRGKLEDSFGNRAAALYRWFTARILSSGE